MLKLYQLIWEIVIFIIAFVLMYISLQRVDFEKMFKKNSTKQIKAILVLISSAVAFMISLGIGSILELIASLE